jgi:hypothetical protein
MVKMNFLSFGKIKAGAFGALLTISFLAVLFSSCSVDKRRYLPGYNVDWNKKQAFHPELKELKPNNSLVSLDEYDVQPGEELASTKESLLPSAEIKLIYPKATEECDVIVFKDGRELIAKVLEIGPERIEYRQCNDLYGQQFSILRQDVYKINYPNGFSEFITPPEDSQPVRESEKITGGKKLETYGLLGSLLIIFPPLWFLSFIFGILSQKRFKKYPNRYSGRFFSVLSLILGIIFIIYLILIIGLFSIFLVLL